jgi:hypothetical protein
MHALGPELVVRALRGPGVGVSGKARRWWNHVPQGALLHWCLGTAGGDVKHAKGVQRGKLAAMGLAIGSGQEGGGVIEFWKWQCKGMRRGQRVSWEGKR